MLERSFTATEPASPSPRFLPFRYTRGTEHAWRIPPRQAQPTCSPLSKEDARPSQTAGSLPPPRDRLKTLRHPHMHAARKFAAATGQVTTNVQSSQRRRRTTKSQRSIALSLWERVGVRGSSSTRHSRPSLVAVLVEPPEGAVLANDSARSSITCAMWSHDPSGLPMTSSLDSRMTL